MKSKKTIKVPECGRDDKTMWCYCEKCEPRNYDLPSDFAVLINIRANAMYENLKHQNYSPIFIPKKLNKRKK